MTRKLAWHDLITSEFENCNDPKFDEPKDSPYWDMKGMLNGRWVLGHKLTDAEKTAFESVLYCGSYDWQYQDGIIWRWYADD